MLVSPKSVYPPLVTTLVVTQISTPPPNSLHFWYYVGEYSKNIHRHIWVQILVPPCIKCATLLKLIVGVSLNFLIYITTWTNNMFCWSSWYTVFMSAVILIITINPFTGIVLPDCSLVLFTVSGEQMECRDEYSDGNWGWEKMQSTSAGTAWKRAWQEAKL